MVCSIQHESRYLLLLQNYYDKYCCHSGKANEHYFLVDPTTVQALHSNHQSLYVNMLKINRVHVVMKVILSHIHNSVMHITAICR